MNIEKLFYSIEEGRLLKRIQLFFVIVTGLIVFISGVDFTVKELTKVYESNEVKQYYVKKVSHIPKGKEKEEMEKKAVEEDKNLLSVEDLKERYYQYVIGQIERNKEYPVSEQKKGHEGSVILRLIILRSGKIKKVQMLRQARYLKLTRAAITALKKSNPFQPYSERIEEDELSIQLEIKFSIR